MKNPITLIAILLASSVKLMAADPLVNDFLTPPDSARPGVYWYFMDGNLNGKEMTADLESMKKVGIGNMLFLEVNVGVARGSVNFMSEPWLELLAQAVRNSERMGLDFTIGIGPGWCGAGGPWIKPEHSMQHLVSSEVQVKGPSKYQAVLPQPQQRGTAWNSTASPFYQDVAVFAFPSCKPVIPAIDEKALFFRDPYSSLSVKPYLPTAASYLEPGPTGTIDPKKMVEITSFLKPDGTLSWNVPAGDWTILRMGRRLTGASSRPAPEPGLGLETDKFDARVIEEHLDNYVGKLLQKIGPRGKQHGLTTLHIDSWEAGAQNWTSSFLEEFKKRRGYDARPLLPVYTGRAVQTVELSERFLWDIRLTAQELVLQKHALTVKQWGRKNGLALSIEPYDMNPAGDLDLGSLADIPTGETWAPPGAATAYSCIEAASIGHVMGRPIIGAETFTSMGLFEAYPTSLKNQADWAFAIGINRLVFHTFAAQPLGDNVKPGMTMGNYGVCWNRNQTWWPMVKDFHTYVSRCSHLMRQGVAVSDVLYLTPEGAPHVFRAPADATEGGDLLPDKRGYGFDGCSPLMLNARASVKNGLIVFPGGSSYRLMVLPQFETMTPQFLRKIRDLVAQGATVVGAPPSKSPSLSAYPKCDAEVKALAQELWGTLNVPATITKRSFGKGVLYWGGQLTPDLRALKANRISESHWIWYPGENARASAPQGTRYFKRILELDAGKKLESATASLSADNIFTLWVNGEKAGTGDNFNITTELPIGSLLRPGKNVLAVAVENLPEGPAGLIGSIQLKYNDGSVTVIQTDAEWLAGTQTQSGWEQRGEAPADWKPSEILGDFLVSPWNRKDESAPLYPSYVLTSDLLKSMGVAGDFEANGAVRYGHRRTQDRDIYLVSNRTEAPVETECSFRVGQGQPELWDPVTGEQRLLPQYEQKGGLTTIPMKFDVNQSFFVIFKQAGQTGAIKTGVNFPDFNRVQEITGGWEVAFDPKWGGPEKVTFDALQDWTLREEPGIKYYSGIATYRKSFDLAPVQGKKVYLDLGVVHDMARVRLNGKDLGVVWCAPWRVEITKELKAVGNQLEIEVANRWPNRLIGDQQSENIDVRELQWPDGLLGGKPVKAGRYTFATVSPYKADSKLFPSGLLGPVLLLTSEIVGTELK
jgi:hypothetical protein